MSVLGSKAAVRASTADRPVSLQTAELFDHWVGAGEQVRGHRDALRRAPRAIPRRID